MGEDADRSPAPPSSEDRHMQGVKAEVAGALQRIAAQERENMSAMRAAVSKAKTKKTAARARKTGAKKAKKKAKRAMGVMPSRCCSGWSPSTKKYKGQGGSCKHWGWMVRWCYAKKKGKCKGHELMKPSNTYAGKYYAPWETILLHLWPLTSHMRGKITAPRASRAKGPSALLKARRS